MTNLEKNTLLCEDFQAKNIKEGKGASKTKSTKKIAATSY